MLSVNLKDAKRQVVAMNTAGVDKMVVDRFSNMVDLVDRHAKPVTDVTVDEALRTVESVHRELGYKMNAGKTASARTAMTMACIITAAIKKDLEAEDIQQRTTASKGAIAIAAEILRISEGYRMSTAKIGWHTSELGERSKIAFLDIDRKIDIARRWNTFASLKSLRAAITHASKVISTEYPRMQTMSMHYAQEFCAKYATR